jgi:hypothetical protein
MKPKSIYKSPELKEKSRDYHGKCDYSRIRPPYQGKSLSIEITFDEAMKLSLALQSCLLSLNRLDRRAKTGKAMGVELSITTETSAIKVIEKKMAID